MKVVVDQEKCVGAGQCVMAIDSVFDQREEDGIVELLDATPPDAVAADVRHAAAMCPAVAITLQD
jgi:ferredoxin